MTDMFNLKRIAFYFTVVWIALGESGYAAKPPANRISEARARSVALSQAPGKVQSSELEFEKRQWVYSFDIKGTDNRIHEVLVNAKTGKVVESTIESAAAEANEAKNESEGK